MLCLDHISTLAIPRSETFAVFTFRSVVLKHKETAISRRHASAYVTLVLGVGGAVGEDESHKDEFGMTGAAETNDMLLNLVHVRPVVA